jgi:hypothetical protein
MDLSKIRNKDKAIDAHGLKIQGRGYLKLLPKSLGGCQVKVSGKGKIAQGSHYFGFYCIFINKSFEIFLGGAIFTLHFPPRPPPLSLRPVCSMFKAVFERYLFKNAWPL